MQTSERIFYTRAFALIALLLIGYLLYLVLSPFFAPLAWSLFIAFLISPLQRWLARKLGGRPAWSAALLTIAVFFMVIGPLAALGAAFAAFCHERNCARFNPSIPIDPERSSSRRVGPSHVWP